METEVSYLKAFRSSAPRHKDVHWPHGRWYMYEDNVCSDTSEPSQSTSQLLSSADESLKDETRLLLL